MYNDFNFKGSRMQLKQKVSFLISFILFISVSAAFSADWHFIPPTDSGVVNVKDYGAKGDGVTDDTMAIRKAINENINKSRYRSNPFIYFPEGTYLVSGPIESRSGDPEKIAKGKEWSAGWRSFLTLVGQSRSKTVIKLKDNAGGYTDPKVKKWVIATGSESDKRTNYHGGGNRAFRHGIYSLTVDVGQGNPGAIGIDFLANNRGSIDGVTIKAPQGSGHTGIALTRNWPGPAFINDVLIDGFDRGIEASHFQYGMSFENITLRNQQQIAIKNNQNVLTFRKLDYEGDVPFYISPSDASMLVVVDSTVKSTSESNKVAIQSKGFVNLRRVKFEGYSQIIDDTSKKDNDLPAKDKALTVVENFDLGVTYSENNQPKALNLPIADIPHTLPPNDVKWVYGGTTGEELQKAIDNGAEYIYIKPTMTVKVKEPVIIRNKVKLIFGMSGMISAEKGKEAIIIEEGASPVVAFENIFIQGLVKHVSSRTFVMKKGDFHEGGYHATGTGKTHIVDVIGRGYQIGPKHTFYGRQVNSEFGTEPLFINEGKSVILSFKMESSTRSDKKKILGTPSFLNRNGGQLEVLGGLLYTLGSKKHHAPLVPAFTNLKGKIAVSFRKNGIPSTRYIKILQKGDNEKNVLTEKEFKGRGSALLYDER
ncbi:MAG: glycoside hydrolase family 55 protein [Lentisphaeraceae bacterium]|nr:glycoside hydrolase family 55 protein [Lentisphaeraceae bacterium]